MTFWQGLAIAVLAGATEAGGDNAEEWAKSAQNFLICLEMLLFSIAHFYCFPTEEWEEGYRVKHTEHKFGDGIALGDFMQDLKIVLMYVLVEPYAACVDNSCLYSFIICIPGLSRKRGESRKC